MKRMALIAFFVIFSGICSADTLFFDFNSGREGWMPGFADFTEAVMDPGDTASGVKALPPPLNTQDSALWISGANNSDDLFMFWYFPIDSSMGLFPHFENRFIVNITMATNADSNCPGAGGGPGTSVFFKIGGTLSKPMVVHKDDDYGVNFDKGNQSSGGEDLQVVGNIAMGKGECSVDAEYELKSFSHTFNLVTTGGNDTAWVIFGTDSGFEGRTTLYYPKIEIIVEKPIAIHQPGFTPQREKSSFLDFFSFDLDALGRRQGSGP